jgi:cytochrome c-type biogenesis protein CcmE
MQARRKNRLYIVLSVLTGLGLTVSLALYALSANIDLFYTPGEILYGKQETHDKPYIGQRLRIGGYVQPGSVRRDTRTLDVSFKLYDARGVIDVSYKGILPDLFREGQGVVAQGTLDGERHITAHQVLAKHDENYTPPEINGAMEQDKTQREETRS